MSYILEALKKSEQERQIGHVPDISMVQETPQRTAARWPRWLLAVLLLNALVLAVIAWRPWEVYRVQRVESATAPAATAPAATTQERQPARPVSSSLPAPIEEPAVSEPAETSSAALPAPVTQMPLPAPQSAPVVEDRITTEVEPELPPRWQDLPPEDRNSLPLPRIDVHVFAREPDRRFVLINLHKYQEGDTVEGGATLEAILADGIVLSYQGQRYRVDRP